jgi:N-acetylglucosaminyldiphosphoundecaprenol N-acetyl-beta-D-mannosaminyltransferase
MREMRRPGGDNGRVEVLGCQIDALDMPTTVDRCLQLIDEGHRPARQVSINASKIVQCAHDEGIAEFVRRSDVVSADGQAVVWAARLLGQRVPERVAGIDLMGRLLAAAADRQLSVYILGAREEVLDRALERMRELHPGLRIAGAHNGYFEPAEEAQVVRDIRKARADLLFVAMDSPRKEQWLDQHLGETGVRFAMGVGGAVDVLADERRRAPRWMQRLGIEWLFRLLQDPARMWHRYLVGNAQFTWLFVRELVRGWRRPETAGS